MYIHCAGGPLPLPSAPRAGPWTSPSSSAAGPRFGGYYCGGMMAVPAHDVLLRRPSLLPSAPWEGRWTSLSSSVAGPRSSGSSRGPGSRDLPPSVSLSLFLHERDTEAGGAQWARSGRSLSPPVFLSVSAIADVLEAARFGEGPPLPESLAYVAAGFAFAI